MRTQKDLEAQQQLLANLRAGEDPAAAADADALQERYYHEQMAALSEDVYASARGVGEPPVGWVRASENLDLLRQQMPQLEGMPNDLIQDMLKPDDSGFRAEIYLPNPAILGPDYKPTVAFKGSNGEVLQANGKGRETGPEDFGANNFPQAIGLKTDYYDRAMRLGAMFKELNISVDYAGHSLGGGMVSAAVAVSGERGTTWNAAGLHPETARQFQRANPDVRLFDPNNLIVAYQVRGEVLTDGLQNNVERMDVAQRRVLGEVLKETADLMQEVPQLQQALTRQLQSMDMPDHARDSIANFVGTLAKGNADQMLEQLPLSAGQVRTLEARTVQDGRIVDRPMEMPLDQVLALAGPALRSAREVQAGAHLGHQAGKVAQAAGGFAQRAMGVGGDMARVSGEQVSGVVSTATAGMQWVSCKTGESLADVAAQGREASGVVVARVEQLKAQVVTGARASDGVFWQGVANLAPDGSRLERFADARVGQTIQDNLHTESAAEAAAQLARLNASRDAATIRAAGEDVCQLMETVRVTADQAQRDTIASAVQAVDARLENAGRWAKATTDYAPAAGAALGGMASGNASLNPMINPTATQKLGELAWTASRFSEHASSAAAEATQRHLMKDTVLPSLRADTDAMERDARARLEAQQQVPQATTAPFNDPYLNRVFAALQAGEGDKLGRIAEEFGRSFDGQIAAQRGVEMPAQQPAPAQSVLEQQQRAAAQQEMAMVR